MKKIILSIIIITSLSFGCKKTESVTDTRVENFENMAKSLGIDPKLYKNQSILSIYERYGSLENWKQTVVGFRETQKKILLSMTTKNNTSRTTPSDILVKFRSPDGNWEAEIPEDREILLHLIDEGIDSDHNLPWADLAGASSVCVMKQLAGIQVYDNGSFLDDDQHDMGYFLPCTTYAADGLIAQTHVEHELY